MRLYQFTLFLILSLLFCFPASADKFDDIREQKGFIPYSEVKQLFADYDYTCFDFDKETETCSQISEETTWRFKSARKITILMETKPRILVNVIASYKTLKGPHGLNCEKNFYESTDVIMPAKLWRNTKYQNLAKKIKDYIMEENERISTTCVAFFFNNQRYILKSFDINGNALADYPPSIVRFFNSQPTLRPF